MQIIIISQACIIPWFRGKAVIEEYIGEDEHWIVESLLL